MATLFYSNFGAIYAIQRYLRIHYRVCPHPPAIEPFDPPNYLNQVQFPIKFTADFRHLFAGNEDPGYFVVFIACTTANY